VDELTRQRDPNLRRGEVLASVSAFAAASLLSGAAPRTAVKIAAQATQNACTHRKDWPDEIYSRSQPAVSPSFPRAEAIAAGHAMAALFVTDRNFAERYLAKVQISKNDKTNDHAADYVPLIKEAYPAGDYTNFNAHDFANIHHATWLVLLQAFSCLIDLNPHENGSWGNPKLCDDITNGSDGHDEGGTLTASDYHNIPNLYGKYAISTTDIPPPMLS
jgi:hypothetical protein